MAKGSQDAIGDLGELIAATALTRPVAGRFNRPLFRVTSLGGKYPRVDFLVDLLSANGSTIGYCFAQVKATSVESNAGDRLPIAIPAKKYNDLVNLPLPTYVIGVDTRSERSYLIAAQRTRRTQISSMPRTYDLSEDAIRIELYKEVRKFWDSARRIPHQSRFTDVE